MKAIALCASMVAFGVLATLIAACGWVIEPDLLIAANTGADDAASNEGGRGDRPDPNCKPTGPEVCDDGIDNDCNDDVDCADSACARDFACADLPPDGWAPLLLADDARPKCPAGTEATDVRVIQGDGAITCGCTCGSSCDATITLTEGTEPTCMVSPTTAAFTANTARCTGKGFDLPSGFTKATSGSGTCAVNDTPTKSDPTDGRTCRPQRAGAGCHGAQRCLPTTAGFATCVAKAGTSTCPATVFTKQWRSGTATNDQRSCAGCSCTSSPCDVELELWSHPNCQGSAEIKITSLCTANGPFNNVKAYKSKVTGGCTQATPSTPRGALFFENEQTICCR